MHSIRWLLAVGWLMLIFSLFYDPVSPWLTDPSHLISPFHLHPEKYLDPTNCVKVQGICLPQRPYAMGARIFWAMIVPISIIILLVFGHEFWRRICPLYFFSQIPRALGIQRQRKIVNPKTGNIRYELVSVEKKSWLGRNYLYLQFGLLYLGFNIRILFVNSDRLTLGLFLLLTIASAITVGFLFKGRSWCQYFCPMAPVQILYTGPRGLLGSDAHLKSPQSITQSTCRTVDSSGIQKSACVSCQSPCIDIDAERSYWEGITRPDQKLVFYGYFGLMLGFYFYYYLYSGNWEYYFSGAWTHESGQLQTLFNPGFYIFARPIPIPKLVASPLTLAVFTAASYFSFDLLEKAYKAYLQRQNKYINSEQVLHVLFVLCTFISFNVFFLFGGRPNLNLLPNWVILIFNALVALFSGTWLYHSLERSKERYFRESLVSSLRRQLNKLALDWSKLLEGRSLQDLLPDEVYILGKVLPNFHFSDRVRVYKGVLLETLEKGNIRSAESLSVLKDMRQQLKVTDSEHDSILRELGVEDANLLDPQVKLKSENKLRLDSYQRAIELLLLKSLENGVSQTEIPNVKQKEILILRQEYAITTNEHQQLLADIFHQDASVHKTAKSLLTQLHSLAVGEQMLYDLKPFEQASVYILLQRAVQQKEKLIITQLLSILETLRNFPEAFKIAGSIASIAPNAITQILHSERSRWRECLDPKIISSLQQTQDKLTQPVLSSTHLGTVTTTREAIIELLLGLLQDNDLLIQAASLYVLHDFNPMIGFQQASQILDVKPNKNWLLHKTAQRIVGHLQHDNQPVYVPTLIAQVKAMKSTQRLVFQQITIRVGRGDENDIVILDDRIHQQHAIFYLDDKGVIVQDLGSNQGLRIGGDYIRNQYKQLNPVDIVRFSSEDDLLILVQWKMQPLQKCKITGSLRTLEADIIHELLT
ncbi:MAG: FHA domain-containing protein [Rhizonema sp. NSF051]|nr:FHA domain-containing protein [Rhizonema sp. NSF051]